MRDIIKRKLFVWGFIMIVTHIVFSLVGPNVQMAQPTSFQGLLCRDMGVSQGSRSLNLP